jgi:hypothetical protein
MRFDIFNIDRRIIYALVFLALSIPLLNKWSIMPARMKGAERFYEVVDTLKTGPSDIAFVAMDFGPGMAAETGTQAEVVVEHLMRKRVPIAFFSQYVLAEPFLESIPAKVAARLEKENPGQFWKYGIDWVNLGYRTGGYLIVQSIPKSENLVDLFKRDIRGNNLADLPAFKGVRTLENIKLLAQFTGLVGVFDTYVQFFQKKDYRPLFTHGCTSITIPEAYIYLDSGQLNGLLEGIAGAAWYSVLLNRNFPQRIPDNSGVLNTGLGVAHLVIIILVLIGNLTALLARRRVTA